jgi:hypothetical protein
VVEWGGYPCREPRRGIRGLQGLCSGSACGGATGAARGPLAVFHVEQARDAGRYSRHFALRLAARFAGPGVYMAGHPSKRPLLWTCTGGFFYARKYQGYALPRTESHGSPGELPLSFLLKRRVYASFFRTKNISRICLTTYYDPKDLTGAFPYGILV